MLDNLSETKSFMNGLEWSPKVLAIQNKDFPYIDLRLDIFDNDNKQEMLNQITQLFERHIKPTQNFLNHNSRLAKGSNLFESLDNFKAAFKGGLSNFKRIVFDPPKGTCLPKSS